MTAATLRDFCCVSLCLLLTEDRQRNVYRVLVWETPTPSPVPHCPIYFRDENAPEGQLSTNSRTVDQKRDQRQTGVRSDYEVSPFILASFQETRKSNESQNLSSFSGAVQELI